MSLNITFSIIYWIFNKSLLLREQRSESVLRASVLVIIFTGLLIIGSSSSVFGAQLDARILPDAESADFTIKYQRNIWIGYPEGGQLADELRNSQWNFKVMADASSPGVQDLMQKLNQKITSDGSSARITDLSVQYSAELIGREANTSIDYHIILSPTLSSYNIRQYSANSPALVDMGWRGLTVTGPIIIDGVEINLPISALKTQAPAAYDIIAGTEGESLMSVHLINADGIKNQQLRNWHFLFDPTGINVDAGTFGLDESISGFVVSSFTMGESSIREGRQVEKEFAAEFTVDKPYEIRSVESADSANLHLIGFANIDNLEGTEIFGVTPTPPTNYASTSSGEFPVMIIYGMAAMAGIGAIAILFISNRKLKAEEGQGQQGIDPSQLQSYSTSESSGGYKTVRGEAQLKGDQSYDQTRSVYEQEKQVEPASSNGTSEKGSMPKGWKPS